MHSNSWSSVCTNCSHTDLPLSDDLTTFWSVQINCHESADWSHECWLLGPHGGSLRGREGWFPPMASGQSHDQPAMRASSLARSVFWSPFPPPTFLFYHGLQKSFLVPAECPRLLRILIPRLLICTNSTVLFNMSFLAKNFPLCTTVTTSVAKSPV